MYYFLLLQQQPKYEQQVCHERPAKKQNPKQNLMMRLI